MKKYRVVTKYEVYYPRETVAKVEYVDDFQTALNFYVHNIQNPETIFCAIDIVGKKGESVKLIAMFSIK